MDNKDAAAYEFDVVDPPVPHNNEFVGSVSTTASRNYAGTDKLVLIRKFNSFSNCRLINEDYNN